MYTGIGQRVPCTFAFSSKKRMLPTLSAALVAFALILGFANGKEFVILALA
jgi:hypothetical protein